MRNLLLAFVVAGLVMRGAPALAEEGEAEAGRALAEQWCSRCHDISPVVRFKREPPGFAAIAVYRTRLQILDRILDPHAAMPQLISALNGDDIDDLVAYITSLDPGAR